jgi:hypothetical protein
MILSHRHKFIFIKTKKTAGTSIEIALSGICGDDDIITRISPEDEVKRRGLGFRGPQNDVVRGARLFHNHIPAANIRALVDTEIWNTYFKFCFERNPWDKVVSLYFWKHQAEPRPTLSEFIRSGKVGLVSGFPRYTIDGKIAVDRVCMYEDLGPELARIREELNLPQIPVLPRAKSRFRDDRRPYYEILSPADKAEIARIFAWEIAQFKYECAGLPASSDRAGERCASR